MDFLDYMATEFIILKTGLDRDAVERIYFGGKPWFDSDYPEQMVKEAKAIGLDPRSILETSADIYERDIEALRGERAEKKAIRHIPGQLRSHIAKVIAVSEQTGDDPQTVMNVSQALWDYILLVGEQAFQRRPD